MKVTQLVSTTGVPASMPAAQAGAIASPFEALGQLADTALLAHDARRRAEGIKERIADDNDASERLARFQVELEGFNLNLKRSEQDPTRYQEAYRQGAAQLRDKALEGASPGAAARFTKAVTPYLAQREVGALHHADDLYVGGQKASLERTLNHYEQLASMLPYDDEAGHQALFGQVDKAITGQLPVIGAAAGAKTLIDTKERITYNRARRAADADPEGFVADAEGSVKWSSVDPGKLQVLKEGAQRKADTRARQAEQTWEKFYKGVEDEAEAERQGLLTAFTSKALAGKATVEELDSLQAMRAVRTPEEYKRFYTMITDEKKRASDPGVLQDVSIRLNQGVPKIGQGELDRHYAEGRLSHQDYTQASSRLTSRLDHLESDRRSRASEGRAGEGQRRSMVNSEQSQAEQMINRAFGITGPFDSLSMAPESKNLLSLAFQELTARSAAFPEFGGKESPLAVAKEIIERLGPMRGASVGLSAEKTRATLRYPTPEALEQAYRAGQIPKPAYDLERKKFLDIGKREQPAPAKPKAQAPQEQPSALGRFFGAGKPKPGTMGRPAPTEGGKP